MSDFEHTTLVINNLKLHVVQAGPADGPLVILLHGFPDFWYGWRNQIEFLASAGYRVLAPDQRGYNLSDKPAHIRDYRLNELADDVVGLIKAAGREKAVVVGHDWGAGVAWWTATRHPNRVERLIILNVPHPALMPKLIGKHPSQLLKSWYIFFFQIPWLPEKLMSLRRWRMAAGALVSSSRPGTFRSDDLREYRRAWAEGGAMKYMLNYYRAVVQVQRAKLPSGFKLPMPVLIIWGVKDRFLNPVGAQTSLEICQDGRLTYLDEASHWVQHEEPDQVNKLIADFIKS